MTVGDLRKALEGVADEMEVLVEGEFINAATSVVVDKIQPYEDDCYRLGFGNYSQSGTPYLVIN